ncbi:phage antirepressor N-terminal domain-containing protein [Pseudomonas sp. NPDC096950]|uniref:phage antirepressor N-terminal domain-containing protein n=1 Tax=Pseudomonas sp. NPDC096950 TaxID=3364485 RepID=UPI00383BC3CB
MNTQLMPVPFHGDTVVLLNEDNEPYVAMKPVVENMGLAWQSQHAKLAANTARWGITNIVIPSLGGPQEAACLPLRKLASWLMTISPNKVAPDLRDKIIQYQEECDEVLWNYWTKGAATRTGAVPASQMAIMSRSRLSLMKELQRSRNKAVRDALGEEIARLSESMGLRVPDLDAIGTVEPPQADVVADFWAALLQLDSKGIVYNHSKDPQLIGLNMPHLGELFAANGIQTVISTEVTTALKRSNDPQFLGLKAVDSTIRKTTTKCWVFKKPAQTQAQ